MKKISNNMTSFVEHLDEQYGKRGTELREQYEQGFEAFKIGAMIQELRKEEGLTQKELAKRCGITQKYISRIENNAGNVRFATLVNIFKRGLKRRLVVNIE